MKIETVKGGVRYTLTNEGLKMGDRVYPLANGRCLPDGEFVLHNLDYTDFIADEQHMIINIHYSDYKPYQVSTDRGYGPAEKYFKILKREEKVDVNLGPFFKTKEWVDVTDQVLPPQEPITGRLEVSDTPSDALHQMQWRQENKDWLKLSSGVALKVLNHLRETGTTKQQFAEQTGLTLELVNRLVKGRENLTLDTLSKVQRVLGEMLIHL